MRIGIYERFVEHTGDVFPILNEAINAIEPIETVQIRNRVELESLFRTKSLDGLIVHWARNGDVREVKQAYPQLKVALYCGMIRTCPLDAAEVVGDIAIGEEADYALLNLTTSLKKFIEFLKQKE
jgi:hypothetical protein